MGPRARATVRWKDGHNDGGGGWEGEIWRHLRVEKVVIVIDGELFEARQAAELRQGVDELHSALKPATQTDGRVGVANSKPKNTESNDVPPARASECPEDEPFCKFPSRFRS